MHITSSLGDGLPSLRTKVIYLLIRRFMSETRERFGVETVSMAVMGTHLHWVVVVPTREALGDGMRFFFQRLTLLLKKHWGLSRAGKVFSDRYFSRAVSTAKELHNLVNYVLRNPWNAMLEGFVAANTELLQRHPALRVVFGLPDTLLKPLLNLMKRGTVPFEPKQARLQPTLW